jgi:hypothetical protein
MYLFGYKIVKSQRLLDLYDKIFQEFCNLGNSQNERKARPVEGALPSAAGFETHGSIQGSTGYFTQDSNRNSGSRPMQEY